MEKFKKTQILRMLLEVIIDIVDNSQKIQVADKNDDSLYLQNKKIVRDLAFSLFQLLSNYNYNENNENFGCRGGPRTRSYRSNDKHYRTKDE